MPYRFLALWLLTFAPFGCGGPDAPVDEDQDGVGTHEGDCDDADPSVFPGADEVWYDGIDQDCDGNDDDQDWDGFPVDEDCDDTDDAISPSTLEHFGDDIDSDCSGDDLGAWTVFESGDAAVGGPRFVAQVDEVELVYVTSEGMNAGALHIDRWDATTLVHRPAQVLDLLDTMGSGIEVHRALEALPDSFYTANIAVAATAGNGDMIAATLFTKDDAWQWSGYGPGPSGVPYQDVDYFDDSGLMTIVGCDPGLYVAQGTLEGSSQGWGDRYISTVNASKRCAVRSSTEVWSIGGPGWLAEWSFNGVNLSLESETSNVGYSDLHFDGDYGILARAGALEFVVGDERLVHDVAWDPVRVRLSMAPDGTAFAVYANAVGDLFLVWGDPFGNVQERQLGLAIAADDLDVLANDRALLIGARAGDVAQTMRMARFPIGG